MNVIETLAWLVVVAFLWGFTNPFMKRGSVGIEKIQSASAVGQFASELKFLASNWRYVFPFAVNLSGSVLYYLILGSVDLSMAVPVTNSLTFVFTLVAGKMCGEEVSGKSTYLGILLVMAGISLCVLDKTWNATASTATVSTTQHKSA